MRSSYGFLAAPAVSTRSARTPVATYNPAAGTCLPCACLVYPLRIVSPIASAAYPPSSTVSRNRRPDADTFTFLLIRPPRRIAGYTADQHFSASSELSAAKCASSSNVVARTWRRMPQDSF
ncbi:uncharacterized protein LOC108627199 [Ceratina calcarata]|uniref:Uncharacterized protein LOC108627199 n=1 Tax=Ceratina calcarata TaxID=156304 RepID=A0AAJ7S5G8_9HYME|nr:uncharacterized protein LOC108627199 [Ceratina calcarata]